MPLGKEELLPNSQLVTIYQITTFQCKTGSLLFTAVNTRPDIVFAVSRLIRFNTNPSIEHYKAADRVLQYLVQTYTLALQLGGGNTLAIVTDVLFVNNTIDRKSSHVYTVKLFGKVIG